MTVRAKFKVDSKSETSGEVTLSPVIGNSPVNDQFFKATPNGSIRLSIVNQPAFDQFEVGREYFVDFIPVDSLTRSVSG